MAKLQTQTQTQTQTSKSQLRRFERSGALALRPQAFHDFFYADEDPIAQSYDTYGSVAVVTICGPLTHHDEWWEDSYDAINRRVDAALADEAITAVVLVVDSPGGDVSGCFETADRIRAQAAVAGKSLTAWCDGQACSAGYALACAAGKVYISKTATVGSIGVISTRCDFSAMNANAGLRVVLVTSGARKGDGHPDVAISEDELRAQQDLVDTMAAVFFEHVNTARGIDASTLQAGVFVGAAAVTKGLADGVTTFDALLETFTTADGGEGDTVKLNKETMAAIRAAAKAGDETAKKMLAAAEADKDNVDAEDKKDEPKSESEDTDVDAADPSDDDKDDDTKKDEPKSVTGAAAKGNKAAKLDAGALALREIRAMRAEQESSSRASMLAERTDLSAEQQAFLAKKPIAEVREYLAVTPAPVRSASSLKSVPRSVVTTVPTARTAPAQSQQQQQHSSPAQAKAAAAQAARPLNALSARMGLTQSQPKGIHMVRNMMFIDVPEGYEPPMAEASKLFSTK